jgi:hypothetical protein
MLSEYNVSHSFWAETINMASYYSNRHYYHPMMEKTPYELLNERKPNIAYFRVFGCKCYILKKGTRLRKFEKKCDEGFLLGYSTTSKAYRVWNLASGTCRAPTSRVLYALCISPRYAPLNKIYIKKHTFIAQGKAICGGGY